MVPQHMNRTKELLVSPLSLLITIFLISRLSVLAAGMSFNTRGLQFFVQYLDIVDLRTNLFESLWYLHIQPPLYNLFLGSVLQMFPGYSTVVFRAVYVSMGLAMCLAAYFITIRLGIRPWLAVVIALVLALSPDCILFENSLLYTYPVTALLCIAAVFLDRFGKSSTMLDGFVFFSVLSVVVLTRSLFHLVWFLFWVLVVLYYNRTNWKKVVVAAGIPMLVVMSWYAKNYVLFGSFSSSTILGRNLSKLTVYSIPYDKRARLVQEGKVSGLALSGPFMPLERYSGHFEKQGDTGIQALDANRKSNGAVNFNNLSQLQISRKLFRDSLYILFTLPHVYHESVGRAFLVFLLPSSDSWHFSTIRDSLGWWANLYNTLIYGRLQSPSLNGMKILDYYEMYNRLPSTYLAEPLTVPWLLVLQFGIAVCYGAALVFRSFRRDEMGATCALTLLFMWGNIVYVALVGNACEIYENNRFRFLVQPFIFIIIGLLVSRLLGGRGITGSR